MIAYRQAREKLIERSRRYDDSPIGPLQGYAYRPRSTEIAHVASSLTASATQERADAAAQAQHRERPLHRPGPHADRVNHSSTPPGVLVYLRDGAAGRPVEPVGEQKWRKPIAPGNG